MKPNRRWENLGVALIVLTMAVLVLTPGASAQSKYKTLHEFTGGEDGGSPDSALILDSSGNLYGATAWGGTGGNCGGLGCGTVFKLSLGSGGWTKSLLYDFDGANNGINGVGPGGLIFDRAGNLYGVAGGGTNQHGIVFELAPNSDGSWSENVLYSFCSLTNCADGADPSVGLVIDKAGNLYGITLYGGTDGDYGTVFELTKAGGIWTEKVLHSFQNNGTDGYSPAAGLFLDTLGNLYGTTMYGGRNRYAFSGGTVFQLIPKGDGSWTERLIYNFCSVLGCQDGEVPAAGLIMDSKRNLYGTTMQGGIKQERLGTVFELSPNGEGVWKEQVLYKFTGDAAGYFPVAGLVFDKIGNLYGTTEYGGNPSACPARYTDGCGLVFKLVPTNGAWVETVLHAFTTAQGHSFVGLTFKSTGHLFGTTPGDGKTAFGSVFEITP
jgi:uncharacterized repeat protein (TIGR03803 family)